ncbi:hypothetical protein V6N13_144132 [Hibiscus sabdariffa]|uniref:Uncharacterized protein n=1 Tax=Hibiscus sabdariffa TaxID=183260 RepID=A0ABR2FJP7_9ROSI
MRVRRLIKFIKLNIPKTLTNSGFKLQVKRDLKFNPISECCSQRKQGRKDKIPVTVRRYVNPAERASGTNSEPCINTASMKTVVAYRQRPELLPSAGLGLAKANHAFNLTAASHGHVSTPLLVTMEAADDHQNEDYRQHIVGGGTAVCKASNLSNGKKDSSKEISFICRCLESDLGFSLMEYCKERPMKAG